MTDDNARRGLLTGLLAGAGAAVATGLGLYAYASRVEPRWLDVRNICLKLPRLSPAFDGYQIAQISDLHMDRWRDFTTLGRAVDRINALEPDLIVITGDYVDESIKGIEAALGQQLARLRARDGVLSVMGNHDYWDAIDEVHAVVAGAGITDISNHVHTLRRGSDKLYIAGVDSVVEMRARLDVVVQELPDDGAAVLLAHEPDFAFVAAASGRFDVQLSGHSHGGQVRVPVLTHLVLPPLARAFVLGLHRCSGMYVYVNRGLGVSGLHARFLCRPEITLLTLRAG